MKSSKLPIQTAKNASKLHRLVKDILVASKIFNGYEIRQEYRVSAINPSFKSNREKIDLVVLGLNVAIELHGEQHFSPVCFGGISEEEARHNLIEVQERDRKKKDAVEEAGWTYISIKFDEAKIITEEVLCERIRLEMERQILSRSEKKIREIVVLKTKIQKPKKYNWPKGRKIPGRRFNGEPIR